MSKTVKTPRQRSQEAYSVGLVLLGAVTAPGIAQATVPNQPTVSVNPEVSDQTTIADLSPNVAIVATTIPELDASVTFTQQEAMEPMLIASSTLSVALPETVDRGVTATANPTLQPSDLSPSSKRLAHTRHDVALDYQQRSSQVTPVASPATLADVPSPLLIASEIAAENVLIAADDVVQTPRRPASSPLSAQPTEVTVPPPNNALPPGNNTVPPANPPASPSRVTTPPSESLPPSSPNTSSQPEVSLAQTTYVVAPRLGVRYNSANTGHEYGYFSVEGFAPLGQVPGNAVTFVEGRVLVQQNGAVGSNLLLGQRFYSPQGDRTYGGYISYDTRNTGRSFFNQIGLGFETLGDVDARLNVYIPVGNTRNRVTETFPGTSQFIPAAGVGTNLLLDRRQEFEAAATAVDLEAGGKIAALGDRGTLRGYGGLYYLSPPGSPSAVGVKARLEALPTDFLNLGLSLQYDGLYNTRAAFTIGVTFPGSAYTNSPNRNTLPRLRGIDRLGETVARQNAIHVADPTIAGQRQDDQVLATSPITGNPLRLLLVNQTGGAGGNGTEASPFTDTATAVGSATAGDVVFVLANAGAPATAAAFTIPAQVAVLSTQSQVPINAVQVNNIQLEAPFLRGAGVAPTLNGTVTMSNDTTLSGFNVNVAGAPGIQATGVTNVLIRDNTIASDTLAAINLDNVSGTADIINNQITGTNVPGINLANLAGTANIINNQITGTGAAGTGINLANTTGTANIVDSRVTSDSGAPALNVATAPGTVNVLNSVLQGNGSPALVAVSIQNLNVSGGQINSTGSPTDGITLDTVTGTATISSAITIDTPTTNGITLTNVAGTVDITGSPGTITSGVNGVFTDTSPSGTINLTNLQIANSTNNGILTQNTGTLRADQITVTNPTNIGLEATNVPNVTISNSTINSGVVAAVLLNTTNNVSITNSNLIGMNAPALSATTSQNISITGGQLNSTNSVAEGIRLDGVTGTVNITSPITIINPAAAGIFLNNASAGTVNIEPTLGTVNTTGAVFGIQVQNSPVPIRFSNFNIDSDATFHFTVDVPSSNVTLTNVTLF
jgi:hypothetical protein